MQPFEIEGWTQTMGTLPLLGIAVAAIALILVLVIVFRLHAFLTLVLVSFLTAIATGLPLDSVVGAMKDGFGGTLASVALLVGLGAMLGKMVEQSGGAKVLADAMINIFGEKRAPLALGVASLILGFPIFFDAGLIVMLPIVFAVAKRLKGSIILYAIPTAAAFSVMHVFLPPHPGPVAAAEYFHANMGLVMLQGFIIVIPTFILSGYLWAKFIAPRVQVEASHVFGNVSDDELPDNPPSVGTIIALLLLPVLLIFMNTGFSTLTKVGIVSGDADWVKFLITLGDTPIALLISTLVSIAVLGGKITKDKTVLEKVVDSALGPICSVVLITGAGGMFGGVLRASGIGDALAKSMDDLGIPLLLAAYLIAVALRLAQGSATVALVTAASLLAPAVEQAVSAGQLSPWGVVCITMAASAGSVFASHVNDSGFWLVGRLTGMDVKTTLKVWTVQQLLESVIGFAISALLFIFA